MNILLWKIRLSVLWIFAAGGWLVSFSINLLMPGVIQGIIMGQLNNAPINGLQMTIYALLYLIPFTMAILCLSLENSLNRRLNIIMGMFFGIILSFDLIMHAANLVKGGQETFSIWLVMITGIAVSIIIVLSAWKYPKELLKDVE